jgi:hypothetical protein
MAVAKRAASMLITSSVAGSCFVMVERCESRWGLMSELQWSMRSEHTWRPRVTR